MFGKTQLPPYKSIIFSVLSLGFYLIVGSLFLAFVEPEDKTPLQIFTSLIIPASVFLLFDVWLWIFEKRFGAPIAPMVLENQYPQALSQQRVEKRGTILLAFIVMFMVSAPAICCLLAGTSPSATLFVPFLVWAWLFKMYGWRRLRSAYIQIFLTPQEAPPPLKANESLRRIAAGIALEQRRTRAQKWQAEYSVKRDCLPPRITGHITSLPEDPQNNPQVHIGFSNLDCLALQVLLTGDGNPYRLFQVSPGKILIDLQDMSSHARIAHIQDLAACHKALSTFFEKDSLAGINSPINKP